ncbi:N/A [soil metagenome]
MAIQIEPIVTSLPGLRAFRWSSDERYSAMKESYAIGRLESGHSAFRVGRNVWESAAGDVQLKQPGDVHREESRRGRLAFQVVSLAPSSVAPVGRVRPVLAAGDPSGAVFQRLHDAIRDGADRLALEVLVAEAVAALGRIDAPSEHTRPVRRAIELLRARIDEPITLDAIAAHAELDKFHLCRAFRAQVGMPPHAYLTSLRIMRAKELLRSGVKARDVAVRVGLYDQSQLNRHFRRLVGTTPGAYARAVWTMQTIRTPEATIPRKRYPVSTQAEMDGPLTPSGRPPAARRDDR